MLLNLRRRSPPSSARCTRRPGRRRDAGSSGPPSTLASGSSTWWRTLYNTGVGLVILFYFSIRRADTLYHKGYVHVSLLVYDAPTYTHTYIYYI